MKQWMVGILVLGAVVLHAGAARAIEGLSGSTWGTVIENIGHEHFQTLGNLNQGIDWFEKDGYRLNTYVELRWRYQSTDGQFFNAYGPALGAAVKKGPLRLGAEYYWERDQSSNNAGNLDDRALVFVDWYYDWDLMKIFK